ncbi:Predicted phosphohydrolase, Cof family, HAD superfamily [Streptomyces prasinopilosus]|uniref:Predicted phosphohydrolase, Cof family, HAD superfamily n=1 Tax=Streptomyces prasinopilosus TaxID=67344 RepID=A0A1G6UYZ5_9ACTN|nr:Predicted phosphohydrolase, Cof family, HAD superfamily [Streptomyces prasinopilosus]
MRDPASPGVPLTRPGGGRYRHGTSASPADLVREFHRAFGPDARETPAEVPPEVAAHRADLLAEEAAEVAEAAVRGDLDRLAHELADVVHVAYGTALVHGTDLDAVISESHRADMSKRGPGGEIAHRSDGKVLKGEHYEAPDVSRVLRRQGRTPGAGPGTPDRSPAPGA